MDEGFPKFSVIMGNIASMTRGSIGVVAALSKYILDCINPRAFPQKGRVSYLIDEKLHKIKVMNRRLQPSNLIEVYFTFSFLFEIVAVQFVSSRHLGELLGRNYYSARQFHAKFVGLY